MTQRNGIEKYTEFIGHFYNEHATPLPSSAGCSHASDARENTNLLHDPASRYRSRELAYCFEFCASPYHRCHGARGRCVETTGRNGMLCQPGIRVRAIAWSPGRVIGSWRKRCSGRGSGWRSLKYTTAGALNLAIVAVQVRSRVHMALHGLRDASMRALLSLRHVICPLTSQLGQIT